MSNTSRTETSSIDVVGQLHTIGRTPMNRITENHLDMLAVASPEHLQFVLTIAQQESPPNESMVGYIGGIANSAFHREVANQEHNKAAVYRIIFEAAQSTIY